MKLEFINDYLSWILGIEIHLEVMNLIETIKEENNTYLQDRTKAKEMIFIRHHLYEGLKFEYLTIKNPLVLWQNLKNIYDHQKFNILPQARYYWLRLRLQDLKSIILLFLKLPHNKNYVVKISQIIKC